jgi:D-lactate dehydrogenase
VLASKCCGNVELGVSVAIQYLVLQSGGTTFLNVVTMCNRRIVRVQGDGSQITVEPGLIGGEINAILAQFKKKKNMPVQYKIGPDPSSIDSCMMGGIVSNNSSGMCCGVSQNTYHTLKDMRIVFADGTVLDTADSASREAFQKVRAS